MDRILEIGHFASGYCGRLFVQAGHEVVRVEPAVPAPGWSSTQALNLFLHSGKRRLNTSDARLIEELANQADIVIVEGDSANYFDELRFDDWTTEVKVAITPFGLTGPKRNWKATPAVLLAMGGYTYLMGEADRAPLTLPGHYLEYQSGQYAYTAANACRLAGESNSIDIGMLEVLMSLSQFTTVKWHCDGEIRRRHGNDFWSVSPSNLYACKDGWAYLNIVPTFWDAFTAFLDRPELVVDERFETNEKRMENRVALHEIVGAVFAQLTRDQIQARATEYRVPLGVVLSFAEVLEDPHLGERDFWQTVSSDGEASIRSPSPGFRIDMAGRPSLHLSAAEDVDG